jgi:hypothetical protein
MHRLMYAMNRMAASEFERRKMPSSRPARSQPHKCGSASVFFEAGGEILHLAVRV